MLSKLVEPQPFGRKLPSILAVDRVYFTFNYSARIFIGTNKTEQPPVLFACVHIGTAATGSKNQPRTSAYKLAQQFTDELQRPEQTA